MKAHMSQKLVQYLKPILDEYKPKSMLDIGCASGAHSVAVANYCGVDYLGLMDGDGSGEIFHDYRSGALAWNDVEVARRFAEEKCSCVVESFVQNTELTIPVDMITSFKSWGTHYPVSEYIQLSLRSLRDGGIIILDLRPDNEKVRAEQSKEIQNAGFRLVSRLGERKHVFERIK